MGNYSVNITTMWLDMFAKIGWAYDLKEPSRELIRKIASKYGDGSHKLCSSPHEVDESGKIVSCSHEGDVAFPEMQEKKVS